jgi:hypothetical protein
MKKIILLLVVLVSFSAVTSCSKDDGGPSLQGKWEYFKEGDAIEGVETLYNYNHQTGCTKDYSMISGTTIMDHNFSGSACTEEIVSSPYTRNGNIITITFGGETFTAEIKTLDESTLKIYTTDPDFPGVSEVTIFKRVN